MSKAIPIVISASNEYAPYAYVSMLSALKNKKETTQYIFYIIIEKEYPESLKNKFKELSEKWNTQIVYKLVDDSFRKMNIPLLHLSYQTYFRLAIPDLIPEEDKIINLGADTLVLKDLSEYYNTDVENYYVAGVKAAGYHINKKNNAEKYRSYGLYNTSKYFNADSVLWNLDKIRKDGLQKTLYELTTKNFHSMDQDIINVAFQDGIKNIPLKYNLMTPYTGLLDKTCQKYAQYIEVYGEDVMLEALDKPVIIHYADKIKPWDKPSSWLANHWWEYAKEAPFPFQRRRFFCIKRQAHIIIKIFGVTIKIKNKKH